MEQEEDEEQLTLKLIAPLGGTKVTWVDELACGARVMPLCLCRRTSSCYEMMDQLKSVM